MAQTLTTQPALSLVGGAGHERRITWRRYVNNIGSSHFARYAMQIDGKPNGLWIRHVSHPTAIRPYYITDAHGRLMTMRKFARLNEAKAAAIIVSKRKA
jgi:hypothetical protein